MTVKLDLDTQDEQEQLIPVRNSAPLLYTISTVFLMMGYLVFSRFVSYEIDSDMMYKVCRAFVIISWIVTFGMHARLLNDMISIRNALADLELWLFMVFLFPPIYLLFRASRVDKNYFYTTITTICIVTSIMCNILILIYPC